jgi:hypothetical protein
LKSSLFYIPGLGLVAVVIAVTFKCVPLFRVTEVTYLSSIREKKMEDDFLWFINFWVPDPEYLLFSDPDPTLF